MSHPSHPHTTPSSRLMSAITVSLTIAAVPAIALPLAPKDIRVVTAAQVTPAAEPAGVAGNAATTPASRLAANAAASDISIVIDDFNHGGLARVVLHQLTSRTTDPDQLQILNDFFEGGVFQSEAHRFLQLFTDPQQQEFINDFVTGGVIQMVRNRLLDATRDPGQRAAIIRFFPDEVTDYRGGPIDVVQRRLIAAAKGNPAVISLVNAVIDNPVLLAVRHLIGGGPIIGTPLHELPPLPSTTQTVSVSKAPETAVETTSVATVSERRTVSKPAAEPATSKPKIKTEAERGVAAEPDVSTAGNKFEPTTAATLRPKPRRGLAIFGQVAETLSKSFAKNWAGANPVASAPAAGGGDTEDAAKTANSVAAQPKLAPTSRPRGQLPTAARHGTPRHETTRVGSD